MADLGRKLPRSFATEFRLLVVRPVLAELGLPGDLAAENLLVGTAAHESGFEYLTQDGGGPALGWYQIEPATRVDLYVNFLARRPALAAKLDAFAARAPSLDHQLATNLAYATAVARLLYWRSPAPLPAADDLAGLARYWKTAFNTIDGAGTEAEWLRDYRALGA